jgi:UDP-3-O-[3-hydroxymyristoyl] N-acetylglucosamine deacetylase/3-hydroxyacyl-[acyl-carrier-protein] dehydratase
VDGVKVHTVEHVLAAAAALRIDNLTIELDANEPPVGDGSALPFFLSLKDAGVVEQSGEREVFTLDRPLHFEREGVRFTLVPSDRFQVTFSIDFDHPVIGHQYASFEITPDVFERELAPARTFGFLHEIERLKEQGLIRGGTLENAIVLGDREILNRERLRFPDEFVRHKILDLIGDLSLFGREIRAHVISSKSGHKTNVDLVHELVALTGRGNGAAGATRPGGAPREPGGTRREARERAPAAPGAADGARTRKARGAAASDGRGGAAAGDRDAPAAAPGAPAASGGNGGAAAAHVFRQRTAPFGADDVLRILPHRFPFLLVDRVLELEPEKRIVGIKNVTLNEPYFSGHFPGRPIMPGVLLVEAMGQVGGLLLMNSFDEPDRKLVFFVGLDDVRFRRPVVPGDTLRIEMNLVRLRGRTCRMTGTATVEGARVAEATLTAVVVDREPAQGRP